jgi:hypothetical protein
MVDELNTNMEHDADFEKENTRRKSCPSATFFTINPGGLWWDRTQASGDRLATKCLIHGTTFVI